MPLQQFLGLVIESVRSVNSKITLRFYVLMQCFLKLRVEMRLLKSSLSKPL